MNNRHIAAVTVLLAAVVVPVANAVIINVPGDQPTIQAEIDAAVDGDEIVVAPGTYLQIINFIGSISLRHDIATAIRRKAQTNPHGDIS